MSRACVIGSGPNGLAAAVALAKAGLRVDVFEAEAVPGGAARTLPLTLPGFLHDFGSAVHPLAAGSPFLKMLPLKEYGLEWIHGDAPLAHPLDDGTAMVLERDVAEGAGAMGEDGREWRRLMEPAGENWSEFAEDVLGPVVRFPRHSLRMARWGWRAMQSARRLALSHLCGGRAQAVFAGLAAHSALSLDQPLSAAVGLMLGAAAHAAGWPIPKGGAQSISRALAGYLNSLGGEVHTSRRIVAADLSELEAGCSAILFDTTPGPLVAIAGDRIPQRYRRAFSRFRHGPGAFKIDFALSEPIPWRAAECRRAITVHLGGRLEEIAESEEAVAQGKVAKRPFVVLAQPTLFDPSRAPEGKHVVWAYCHVPNGSTVDMTERIEEQIERFAPGFRDCVLARRVWPPSALEAMDANLVGGDFCGGAMHVGQVILRPTLSGYSTGNAKLFLCSASTPPGGGVHGMCGYHAARLALKRVC